MATNMALGDVFCALSSLCYAISNVGQEAVVKDFDTAEFLGMLGLWGVLFNGVQMYVCAYDGGGCV